MDEIYSQNADLESKPIEYKLEVKAHAKNTKESTSCSRETVQVEKA